MKHIPMARRVILQFSVLLLVSIFNPLCATQVIPDPVHPQIGENLWQMNYRQSIAIDDIMDTTTLCCECDYFISQEDIVGQGGGFTIDRPGNWCVSEPLYVTQEITIANQENVSLNLHGHTISSSIENGNIIFVQNSPGTRIFNGSLVGTDLGGVPSSRFGILLDASDNAIMEDIQTSFQGTLDDLSNFQTGIAFSTLQSTRGALFKNCSASGVYLKGFTIDGSYCTLEACRVVNFSGDLIDAGSDIFSGVGYWISGSNNYLNSCTSIGGIDIPTPASSGSTGFVLDGGNNLARNCTALSHKAQQPGPTPFIFPPGVGFYIAGTNCDISECTAAYNDASGLENVGSDLILCNNTVHNNGTNYSATTNTNLCNLLCSDYITQDRLPFIITESGTYCLSENLDELFGDAAIVVADFVEDVVIDFGSFSLRRSAIVNNEPLITIGDGCLNVSIQNGTLKGNNLPDSNNIAIGTTVGDTETILIDSMLCADFFNALTFEVGVSNIFVSNCTFSNQLDAVITCSEITNLNIEECDSAHHSSFLQARFSENISVNSCSMDHSSSTTFAQLDFRNTCKGISCTDLKIRSGLADGILSQDCSDLSFSNVSTTTNMGNGMLFNTCNIINLSEIESHQNQGAGLFFLTCFNVTADVFACNNIGGGLAAITLFNASFSGTVEGNGTIFNSAGGVTLVNAINITIADLEARQNFGNGFFISGTTAGVTPAVCPITILGCTAQFNSLNGFIIGNVGGLTIKDSVATGNGANGFQLTTGTWNAQTIGCTATSNGLFGFVTWDSIVPVLGSLYYNRYHTCFASVNNVSGTIPPLFYVPGFHDFAQGNGAFIMSTAIAAPLPAIILCTLIVLGIPVVATDWCSYG